MFKEIGHDSITHLSRAFNIALCSLLFYWLWFRQWHESISYNDYNLIIVFMSNVSTRMALFFSGNNQFGFIVTD